MNKGIVMEMTDRSIIVMRQNGKFDKISRKNRSCEVGEEIIYADSGINWRSPSVAGRSALVAAVVFCLVVFASFAGKLGGSEVVAYVSLDINPSVEMGIDEKEQVLELRGLNDDGSVLIQEVDFKKKTLENVTAALLDKAEQSSLAKGEATIVIASSVVTEQSSVNDTQIADKLRKQVTEHIKQTHPEQASSYQVEAFAAPQEVREEANKSNVSMGKYSVYLNAKSNGIDVKIDDLKKESIHQIVKNNPESKTAIVQPEKAPTKSDIKKWIEEEKSGELDKKVQEKKKEQDSKDGSKTTGTNKNDPKRPGAGGTPTNSNTGGSTGNANSGGNKKDDKNDKNSKNGKNDKDDKDDKDDDDDRKDNRKPGSTSKPTPTPPPKKPGTVTPTPKPGTPVPGTARPGSTAKPTDRDDDKKKDDDKKDDGKKDEDKKPATPPPKKDDGKKDDDRKRAEEEAKRIEEQKKQAEKKKEEERKKEQPKKEQEKKEQDKKDSGNKNSDNRRNGNDNDDDADDRRR